MIAALLYKLHHLIWVNFIYKMNFIETEKKKLAMFLIS